MPLIVVGLGHLAFGSLVFGSLECRYGARLPVCAMLNVSLTSPIFGLPSIAPAMIRVLVFMRCSVASRAA